MTMQQMTGREPNGAVRAPDGAAATAEAFMETTQPTAGLSVRAVEIATALVFAFGGALAIWDSARLGAGWGPDGPKTGTFPFWIGVLLVMAATAQLVGTLRSTTPRGEDAGGEAAPLFLSWEQARTVATVFIPTALYVAAIPFTGIYVASAVLVAWFMTRLGGFPLLRAVPAGIATAVVTFVVFEIWFLVALPKGPLEELLGF
jgi:hypothetical protein